MQATPYYLVYGLVVVLSLEYQIPPLEDQYTRETNPNENTRVRLDELEALD